MFSSVRQCGFLPVFQSFGSSPLELWHSKVQFGCIRRVTDEQVRALTLELSGTNVSTCYINCPKNPRASLGILMPFLVMVVKNMNRYFTFEITILDDSNVHRRFRMSNFQKTIQIHYFSTSMPLCLEPGWNEIYFDLSDITRKAFKTGYMETTRLQIHANCRIRVIYFCDKIYDDKDIPQKLKMFLPTTHECRKKKKESAEEKREPEIVVETEFEESEFSEEEAEEMYFVESLKSMAEATTEQLLKPKSETDIVIEEQTSLISRIDEEDEDLSEEDLEEDVEENVKTENSIKEEVPEMDVQQETETAENAEDDQSEHEAIEG